MISGVIIALIYLAAIFAEFLAPVSSQTYDPRFTYAPPLAAQILRHRRGEGVFHPLYVNGYTVVVDPIALNRNYQTDPSIIIPVGFFVPGEPYKFWGLFDADRHLIGPVDRTQPFYLFGADRLGRDVFSRTIHGTRVSMSVGLIGVTISLILGIILGGISGLYGGWVDDVIQRAIELLTSIPTIPLWMGLAAAVPISADPLLVYIWITVILSSIGWTDLARVVRGRFLSLKTEDFIIAARLDGCSQMRIIWRHMVPSFMSPHHRLGNPGDPHHDPGRNGSVLPRYRPQASRGELGRVAAGGAEHHGRLERALVVPAGPRRDRHRIGIELPGRRTS